MDKRHPTSTDCRRASRSVMRYTITLTDEEAGALERARRLRGDRSQAETLRAMIKAVGPGGGIGYVLPPTVTFVGAEPEAPQAGDFGAAPTTRAVDLTTPAIIGTAPKPTRVAESLTNPETRVVPEKIWKVGDKKILRKEMRGGFPVAIWGRVKRVVDGEPEFEETGPAS